MDERRCSATRRDGTPCQTPPSGIGTDGFCWAHSPAQREARRAARAKGGRQRATAARAEKLVPAVLRPVLLTLLQTLQGAKVGTLDPRQATAVASVARAIVAVYTAGTLEERLQALEAAQVRQEEERTL